MGMSCAEFWRLTWWEWGLRVIRYAKKEADKLADQELILMVSRIMIADFRNVHRKKGSAPLKAQDIFKLSFDKEEQKKVSVPLSPEEVEKKFGKNGR